MKPRSAENLEQSVAQARYPRTGTLLRRQNPNSSAFYQEFVELDDRFRAALSERLNQRGGASCSAG